MDAFIDEQLIISLYTDRKFSSAQIGQYLHISISKVVRILEARGVPKRTISQAVTELNITKYHKQPFRLKEKLSPQEYALKMAATMLYWGEGGKTGNVVRLANSNPDMIRVFLAFLRDICRVEEQRIKLILHIYPDHEEDIMKRFWSSVTHIPQKRFYKTQILKGKQGTYKRKSQYGTATIQYSDTILLKTILGWIEEAKERFLHLPE